MKTLNSSDHPISWYPLWTSNQHALPECGELVNVLHPDGTIGNYTCYTHGFGGRSLVSPIGNCIHMATAEGHYWSRPIPPDPDTREKVLQGKMNQMASDFDYDHGVPEGVNPFCLECQGTGVIPSMEEGGQPQPCRECCTQPAAAPTSPGPLPLVAPFSWGEGK